MRKKICDDVLDDIDEIKPDVPEEDERPFVTEMFDASAYSVIFCIRRFRLYDEMRGDELRKAVSYVCDSIRTAFGDGVVVGLSPIYVSGDLPWLGRSERQGVLDFVFGVNFLKIGCRAALKVLMKLDSIGKIAGKIGLRGSSARAVIKFDPNGLYGATFTDCDNDGRNIRGAICDIHIGNDAGMKSVGRACRMACAAVMGVPYLDDVDIRKAASEIVLYGIVFPDVRVLN